MSAGVELVHVGFNFKKLINQNISEAAKKKRSCIKWLDIVCVEAGGDGGIKYTLKSRHCLEISWIFIL